MPYELSYSLAGIIFLLTYTGVRIWQHCENEAQRKIPDRWGWEIETDGQWSANVFLAAVLTLAIFGGAMFLLGGGQ